MKNFISSKPYKQWCRTRGIDFISYIRQFPFVARRLNIHPKVKVLPEAPKEILMQKPAFLYKVCWFEKLIKFLKGGK